jgi:hypothetical protein
MQDVSPKSLTKLNMILGSQFFPPFNNCSMLFLKEVLVNRKNLLPKNKIVLIKVHKYAKFSLATFIEMYGGNEAVITYFQVSCTPAKSSIERIYTLYLTLSPRSFSPEW